MKERYLDVMEKALSAYPYENIERYFNDVKQNGLTEHGFPRLTANIGILISHRRRTELLPIFLEMMDFCCETIPTVKAANDFSVREIVCCIREIEKSNTLPKEKTSSWRSLLAAIEPTSCYNKFATSPTDTVRNWALFTAVSEYYRLSAGIGGDIEFIELQLLQQLQWFDENGMYMDRSSVDNHQPIVYDIVPRGILVVLLNEVYNGKYREQIDEILKRSALFTLKMQSPTGEIAFGGRSNQFIHNEGWLATIFEFEAKRYNAEGSTDLAKLFKSAADRALSSSEYWLLKVPIRHVKNRFSTETQYGCESYAYFDKYMITAASFFYTAYLVCDESIPTEPQKDRAPCVWQTSKHFHKLFLKSGGYGLEFDIDADPQYDASGLGRVHREGAPSAICLSCPCPAEPSYTTDTEKPVPLSLCSGIKRENGEWEFASFGQATYEDIKTYCGESKCEAEMLCGYSDNIFVKEKYTVSENGVEIKISGNGEIAYSLPAFSFDGENSTEITLSGNSLCVDYEGYRCSYTASEAIIETMVTANNRNGYYKLFYTHGTDNITINIKIQAL